MTVALIIPTLNASAWLDELLPAVARQTVQPDVVLCVDSSSEDDTRERFEKAGSAIRIIGRSDFDHGGTRQQALDTLSDVDHVIFMTQDAFPSDEHAFANLIEPFQDPTVGMVYGRQLPRRAATAIEAHARLFNYPPQSHEDDRNTLRRRGIKATFCSNSFAAYSVTALKEVGGFPEGCIFGEDAIVATRMILAGWKKSYASGAQVYHSHSYSFAQDFRRNFDVGVMHAQHASLWLQEAMPASEGFRFVRSELMYLARHDPRYIPSAFIRSALKLLGYSLGANYQRLPKRIIRSLSMNRNFWRDRIGEGA
jgi:rhamnosyltransferase